MLPSDINQLLQTTRPDVATWTALCRLLDAASLSPQQLGEVKKALSSWPREVPRRAPREWIKQRSIGDPNSYDKLLSLCCDVTETESLYNYYIAQISTSPKLRLRDGSPAVTMWRQLRGRVQLQNGTSIELGAGQPGLADLGGIMTVEWDLRGVSQRANFYVEIEVKIDGKLPPSCFEYRGDSTRMLTQTEKDQVQRQLTQRNRGGFYSFVERAQDAVGDLVSFRDDIKARIV